MINWSMFSARNFLIIGIIAVIALYILKRFGG